MTHETRSMFLVTYPAPAVPRGYETIGGLTLERALRMAKDWQEPERGWLIEERIDTWECNHPQGVHGEGDEHDVVYTSNLTNHYGTYTQSFNSLTDREDFVLVHRQRVAHEWRVWHERTLNGVQEPVADGNPSREPSIAPDH